MVANIEMIQDIEYQLFNVNAYKNIATKIMLNTIYMNGEMEKELRWKNYGSVD